MKEVKINENGFIEEIITNIYEIKWIAFPLFSFDKKWRAVKTKQYSELREKDSQCFVCKHKFKDNEHMGLVSISGHVNVLCCDSCCTTASSKSGIKMYGKNKK